MSDARSFVAEVDRSVAELPLHVAPVVEKGADNIMRQMRDEMRSSASFGALAGSIGYDILEGGLAAEIGPASGGSGAGGLGFGANIPYFGGSNGGGGTVADPIGALNAEAPRFEDALAQRIAGALS